MGLVKVGGLGLLSFGFCSRADVAGDGLAAGANVSLHFKLSAGLRPGIVDVGGDPAQEQTVAKSDAA